MREQGLLGWEDKDDLAGGGEGEGGLEVDDSSAGGSSGGGQSGGGGGISGGGGGSPIRMGASLVHSVSVSELLAAERGDESMLRHISADEKGRADAYRARAASERECDAMVRPPPFFEHTLPLVRQGFNAIVDDSFTRCFKSKKVVRWNWNCYLFPAYLLGVVVRYTILFPLRLLCLLLGFLLVMLLFPCVKFISFFRNTTAWEVA